MYACGYGCEYGSYGTFLDTAHIKEFPQQRGARRIARMDRMEYEDNAAPRRRKCVQLRPAPLKDAGPSYE
ncbi:hypothetical protein GCM10020254_09470 [Streptomyces goshikiensis]